MAKKKISGRVRISARLAYSSGTAWNFARQPRRSLGLERTSSIPNKARSTFLSPSLCSGAWVLTRGTPAHNAATFGEVDEQLPLLVLVDRIIAAVLHPELREVKGPSDVAHLDVNLMLGEEADLAMSRHRVPGGVGNRSVGARRRGWSSTLRQKSA